MIGYVILGFIILSCCAIPIGLWLSRKPDLYFTVGSKKIGVRFFSVDDAFLVDLSKTHLESYTEQIVNDAVGYYGSREKAIEALPERIEFYGRLLYKPIDPKYDLDGNGFADVAGYYVNNNVLVSIGENMVGKETQKVITIKTLEDSAYKHELVHCFEKMFNGDPDGLHQRTCWQYFSC